MLRWPFWCVVFLLVCSQAAAQDGSAFALHLGAAYARVPDAEFDVVQSLAGQDLFSEVEASESTSDFVAFVSQRLWTDSDAGVRAYASIGTGLRDPARMLYLGGSIAVSRTFFTAGLSTATVEEGVTPVPDQIFRGSGDRTLFAALDRTRTWGFFAALSFSLIQ